MAVLWWYSETVKEFIILPCPSSFCDKCINESSNTGKKFSEVTASGDISWQDTWHPEWSYGSSHMNCGELFLFAALGTQWYQEFWEGVALASSLQCSNLFTPHIPCFFPDIAQTGCENECIGDSRALSSPGSKQCPAFQELFLQYSTQVTECQRWDFVTMGNLLKLSWVSVSSSEHDYIIQRYGL